MALSQARADALARSLDLELDSTGVCCACLGFVSLALDAGDAAEVARELRRMTPDLWGDGLAEPAFAAVRRACERNVPDAAAALVDLEQSGAGSVVARSIVRHLARELSLRVGTQGRLAPPPLN